MSKFVKDIVIEREFEGDTVKIVCRPMDKATAMKLKDEKTEGAEAEGVAMTKILDMFMPHLQSVSGLRDENGDAVPIETVRDSAYFVGLLAGASLEWATRSMPTTGKQTPSAS